MNVASPRQLDGFTRVGNSGQKLSGTVPQVASRQTGARAITVPPLSGAPRGVIAQLAKRTVCAYVPDRSGSMYGAWGDPSDVCGAAAESLIELQRRSGGGRALVVPWGTDAPANLVVGPLDVRKGKKALSTALREHTSLGGTDLPRALRQVKASMPALAPDDIPLIFVLSDGIESVTAEMHSAIAALPKGSVHMCLVDRANGCTPQMEAAWRTVKFGSFTRLNHLDVSSMTAQLVDIYATTLGLTTSTRTTNRKR